MREDVEALTVRLQETSEKLCELKTRLVSVKEAAAASKARSDRQVAQLTSEKDATVDAMRELRNSVAELNEVLGLSHVEEAWLCTLGVELRNQVSALHNEKENNLNIGTAQCVSAQLGGQTGPRRHHWRGGVAVCVQGDGVERSQG